MELYMSKPYANIGSTSTSGGHQSKSELYMCYLDTFNKIFDSYSCTKEIDYENLNIPSKTDFIDREEFISVSLKDLLQKFSAYGKKPNLLFDCYSSAPVGGPAHTYRLAKINELPNIIPMGLNGQGGTEFVQSIQLLNNFQDKIGAGAIITASQVIVSPDTRKSDNGYYFGDGASSVIVTPDYYSELSEFKILKADIFQFGDYINFNLIEEEIERSLKQLNKNKSDIKWSITHNFNNVYNMELESIFPLAKALNREAYPTINFGCADPLITLHENLQKQSIVNNNYGVMWFVGRFKSIGYLILSPVA